MLRSLAISTLIVGSGVSLFFAAAQPTSGAAVPAVVAQASARAVTVNDRYEEYNVLTAFLDGPDGKLTVTGVGKYLGGKSYTVEKKDDTIILTPEGREPKSIPLADMKAGLTADYNATNLKVCQQNVKNLGTALEMYSIENFGRYPLALSGVVSPTIMQALPTCPAARADTYTAGYESTSNPDNYVVVCSGQHHVGVPSNYPQYSSAKGFIMPAGTPSPADKD